METIYNFSDSTTEYIYSLHPKSEIILHIKRITIDTASLFFTNQLNQKIDIPSDFILFKNGKILKLETNALHHFSALEMRKGVKEYQMYWRKNYDIVYNGDTICNIRPKEKCSVDNTVFPNIWIIYN